MVHSKFIIDGEDMIMAKCQFHKQLSCDVSRIKGGGAFRWDDELKAFILSGSSYDFGYANIEDIKECIKTGRVYGNVRMSRKMCDYTFYYNTQSELIKLN